MDIHGTNVTEVKTELDSLLSRVEMALADCTAYGGPSGVYKELQRELKKILALFSEDLVQEMKKQDLLAKAKRLRDEAEALEKEAMG